MGKSNSSESILELASRAISQGGVPTGLRRVVVGCSGGGDSTAAAVVIRRLFPNASLLLVRVDHVLPEAEFPEDYEAVTALANRLHAAAIEIRVEVREAMEETGESLEMAARRLRHMALQDAATLFHAEAIVLGHHADDQVETMLLRLARGTSAAGLSAMSVWGPGTAGKTGILRPLLGCTREALRDWLRSESIEWREDPTNEENDVLRNRLRNQVLPKLYEALGTEAREGFLRTASLIQSEEREWLQPMVEEAERTCLENETFSVPALREMVPPLRRRLLLRAAIRAGVPAAVLSGTKVEMLETLVMREGEGTTTLDVGEGFQAVRAYDELWIERGSGAEPVAESLSILRVEESQGFEKRKRTDLLSRPQTAWVSRTKIPDPSLLSVRRIQEGDRFLSMGAEGSTKLSDILINRKVPRPVRSRVEVVCLGNEVVWIPGHGVNATYAVETPAALSWRLTVEREGNECDGQRL